MASFGAKADEGMWTLYDLPERCVLGYVLLLKCFTGPLTETSGHL